MKSWRQWSAAGCDEKTHLCYELAKREETDFLCGLAVVWAVLSCKRVELHELLGY